MGQIFRKTGSEFIKWGKLREPQIQSNGATLPAAGTVNFTGLPKGYYYAQYLLEDGYNGIGNKVFFKVGDIVTELWTNKPVYTLGENITASWTDSPGIIKDWLGIYPQSIQSPDDNFVSYTYFDGITQGTKAIQGTAVPSTPGTITWSCLPMTLTRKYQIGCSSR